MKKILSALTLLIICVCLCSCTGISGITSTPIPIPEVNPLDVLSADDVYEAVNYEYAPVLEGDTYYRNGNVSTASYRGEVVGQYDPITITIAQHTDGVSKESVWYGYDYDKSKRPSAETIPELGEDAFIAFPSIHIYDRGCHIQITAGSGSDEWQRNLLITLARKAVSKFEGIMPADL